MIVYIYRQVILIQKCFSTINVAMNQSTVVTIVVFKTDYTVQWNLSITDALVTEKHFVMQRFPPFGGYFTCVTIYLDPQKQSVIERFMLSGEL